MLDSTVLVIVAVSAEHLCYIQTGKLVARCSPASRAEVYVILLPSLGAMAEIISVFSRKPIFAYKTIVYMALISSVLAVMVWAHHQFVSGIDPRMATFFSVGTIIISIPFAGIFLSYMATLWGGSIRFSVPMIWALGFIG